MKGVTKIKSIRKVEQKNVRVMNKRNSTRALRFIGDTINSHDEERSKR